MKYERANTDWMANSKFGIFVHWTTQSMPTKGEKLPFKQAIVNFDVERFVGQIEETGADYLVFTVNHAEYYFPGPVKEVMETMPSRAMERDLIREIAEALKKRGKRLMLYYNLKCDSEWETAMGYFHPSSFEPFIENLCRVVGGISEHYSGLLDGWWFDCGFCVDTRSEISRTTAPSLEGKKFKFPWEKLNAAAKKGGDNILVTYASGIGTGELEDDFIYENQDYWDGERGHYPREEIVPLAEVCLPPTNQTLPNGMQWHQVTCLDNREWVHKHKDAEASDPLYSEDEVREFVKICDEKKAAITFNVEIFQEGLISDKAVKFLSRI